MPPNKKAVAKAADKIVDDKTFGLVRGFALRGLRLCWLTPAGPAAGVGSRRRLTHVLVPPLSRRRPRRTLQKNKNKSKKVRVAVAPRESRRACSARELWRHPPN